MAILFTELLASATVGLDTGRTLHRTWMLVLSVPEEGTSPGGPTADAAAIVRMEVAAFLLRAADATDQPTLASEVTSLCRKVAQRLQANMAGMRLRLCELPVWRSGIDLSAMWPADVVPLYARLSACACAITAADDWRGDVQLSYTTDDAGERFTAERTDLPGVAAEMNHDAAMGYLIRLLVQLDTFRTDARLRISCVALAAQGLGSGGCEQLDLASGRVSLDLLELVPFGLPDYAIGAGTSYLRICITAANRVMSERNKGDAYFTQVRFHITRLTDQVLHTAKRLTLIELFSDPVAPEAVAGKQQELLAISETVAGIHELVKRVFLNYFPANSAAESSMSHCRAEYEAANRVVARQASFASMTDDDIFKASGLYDFLYGITPGDPRNAASFMLGLLIWERYGYPSVRYAKIIDVRQGSLEALFAKMKQVTDPAHPDVVLSISEKFGSDHTKFQKDLQETIVTEKDVTTLSKQLSNLKTLK